MARGYPDFFGVPIFPSYGPLERTQSGPILIATANNQDVINVAAKGRSYGGHLEYHGTGNVFDATQVIVTIDGQILTGMFASTLLERGHQQSYGLFARLLGYWRTATTEYVNYQFSPDFTWGLSCVINVINNSGANILGTGAIYWAEVK